VTEEGEKGPEEYMRYRIPHTHCERQKHIIIIIIIIIVIIHQWPDSRQPLNSSLLGLQKFL
jgi:hypothetical protein